MKKMFSACLVLVVLALIASALLMPALAEEAAAPAAEPQTEAVTATDNSIGSKAIAAAVVGAVATAGAIGMALAISKSTSGMARQPEVAGKINSAMMLGLVFIETAIIYALIVAILIIFVL